MRSIELEEGLTVRFPGQDDSFAAGVEIGVLATLMAMKQSEFARVIHRDNVAQALMLARKLGYHIADRELVTLDTVRVTLRSRALAPKLRLVASGS